MTLTV